MAGSTIKPREFRDGVMLELEEELRKRCITYGQIEDGQMQIGFELTERAYTLIGMWAMAAEISERQNQ